MLTGPKDQQSQRQRWHPQEPWSGQSSGHHQRRRAKHSSGPNGARTASIEHPGDAPASKPAGGACAKWLPPWVGKRDLNPLKKPFLTLILMLGKPSLPRKKDPEPVKVRYKSRPSNKPEPVEEEPEVVFVHARPHAWHLPLGRHVEVLEVVVEVAFEDFCLLSRCGLFLKKLGKHKCFQANHWVPTTMGPTSLFLANQHFEFNHHGFYAAAFKTIVGVLKLLWDTSAGVM